MEHRLLYRVTEVAVFLNVSRSKVYELLGSGDLRSVKIDRTRLVRGSDLRDYVESLLPVPEPSHSVRRCTARSHDACACRRSRTRAPKSMPDALTAGSHTRVRKVLREIGVPTPVRPTTLR